MTPANMSDEKVAAKSEFTLPSLFVDKNTSYHYANHRHSYSEELFRLISDFCKEKLENLNLAVDVGCGPGNSTVGFTKHFKQVRVSGRVCKGGEQKRG